MTLSEIPMRVFGVAVATTLFPTLGAAAARNDQVGFYNSFQKGMFLLTAISVPITVLLGTLSLPIVSLVFERGAFSAQDVSRTADTIVYFTIGAVPVAWGYVQLRAFYALRAWKDILTATLLSLIVNAIGDFFLARLLGIAGIALATSLAGLVYFLWMLLAMRHQMTTFDIKYFLLPIIKFISAGTIMVSICTIGHRLWFHMRLLQNPTLSNLVEICLVGGLGLIAYGTSLWALGIRSRENIQSSIK
jgi:putative peptidoglycan lipid II flippase